MKFIRLFVLAFLIIPVFAFADSAVSVTVPDHCTVIDSDGVSHSYSGQHVAICAVQTALDTSGISEATFSNEFPAFGLFVTSLDGVAANPSSQYWALFHNSGYASFGLTQLPVAAGDTITLELQDFSGSFLGSRVTFTIAALLEGSSGGTSSSGKMQKPPAFSTAAALSFLKSKQQSAGNFGSDAITDWVAIALASAEVSGDTDALKRYLELQEPETTSVTDHERHAMALLALNIDPYSGTAIDHISPITNAFDGTQVGDPLLVNDDIFALVVLPKTGYAPSDEIIQKTLSFVVARQHANGSWEESVDLTGAAIQALATFSTDEMASTSLQKARGYLKAKQASTGGWGNSFSTSWAWQGLKALGEPVSAWTVSGLSPLNLLGYSQLPDGGLEPNSAGDATRVWATAYAIPAALGRSWNDVLHSFPKPSAPEAPTPIEEVVPTIVVEEVLEPAVEVASTTETTIPAPVTELVLPAEVIEEEPLPTVATPSSAAATPVPGAEQRSQPAETEVQPPVEPEPQTASAASSVDNDMLGGAWGFFKWLFGHIIHL